MHVTIHASIERLPEINQWCFVFVAGFDHVWLRGRLESGKIWELDTNERDIPGHVLVDDELVTHWIEELPSPFDLLAAAELPAVVVEGRIVEPPPPDSLLGGPESARKR